jgi:hypothetical protein
MKKNKTQTVISLPLEDLRAKIMILLGKFATRRGFLFVLLSLLLATLYVEPLA